MGQSNKNKIFLRIMNKNKALFLISSPLQLLFSQNAIKTFYIDEATYVFFKDSSERYKQMENIALHFELNYQYGNGTVSLKEQLFNSFRNHNAEYNYLFIGNFYQSLELVYLPFLKKKGKVVYLDDGNNSIAILKGHYDNKKVRAKRKLISLRYWYRNYSINNYFTIYGDIISKDFNIIKNVIEQKTTHTERNGIYIIGTNIHEYCYALGISTEDFKNRIEHFISELKEKGSDKITYIPHSRDTSNIANEICEKMGIIYQPQDLNIEVSLLLKDILPESIYGFGSTALYTLRHIFPNTPVFNVFFDGGNGRYYNEYVTINDYYLKSGINLIVK